MKLSKASGVLRVMALAAIAASPAAMADVDDSGWYVGLNIGQSRAEIDRDEIEDGLLAAGLTTTRFSDDERDFGYKTFLGYQFSRYFALEGGYFDLGEFSFRAETDPVGSYSGEVQMKGINLDAVGFLPFTDDFAAFARVGVNYARTEDWLNGTGAITVPNGKRSEEEANYKWGLGLEYDFNEAFSMRLEADRYRVSDAINNEGDVDLVSLGFIYRFVADSAPAPVAPAPAEPAPAEPLPVLVVAPAPVETERYCSILDIEFEINEEDIQREEKERLGVVGTFMTKYPETTAVIEGHTDNVGTDAANQTLSQQRAQSVVTYLVNTFSIAPSRLTAAGYGESRPVESNDTEEGKRANRRINAVIACATDYEGLSVKPARVTMALLLEFDANDAAIRPEYHDDLSRVATFLNANPTVTATVEGHTGNLQATPELAQQMSLRRAQNVVNYLVDKLGIARSRLKAEGFGKGRRWAYNTTLEGQQENRRVNIIMNYPRQ